MSSSALCRSLAITTYACLLSVALLSSSDASAQSSLRLAPLAQGGADVAAHKDWMNEASDAQDDFRFAVTDKDQKAAVEALVKLEALMARTEDYWTAKKASDGVKLAKDARAFAAQAQTATKSGNMTGATGAFDKMGAACNTCHELHLEKR